MILYTGSQSSLKTRDKYQGRDAETQKNLSASRSCRDFLNCDEEKSKELQLEFCPETLGKSLTKELFLKKYKGCRVINSRRFWSYCSFFSSVNLGQILLAKTNITDN